MGEAAFQISNTAEARSKVVGSGVCFGVSIPCISAHCLLGPISPRSVTPPSSSWSFVL